ncbi:MAG: hypothetical protein U1F43_12605 [Myxococcota bacterium]
MRWLALGAAAGGCGIDLTPNIPDVSGRDTAPGDIGDALDQEIPDHIACTSDDDCAAYAGCCLDPRCKDGVCMPFYVPGCCTTPGPCATTTIFHNGTCAQACVPDGCSESLSLPLGSCDETTWALARDADGLAALAFSDATPDDRSAWTLAAARPFAGQPSLHPGDVVCPTYYDGPLDADCRPLASGDAGTVTLGLATPSIQLPGDHPSVLQLWLWIDVGAGHVDGLTVAVERDGAGVRTVWDPRTATDLPRAAWTLLLVDLSEDAGNTVRIRLEFDTYDGRDNDHPGVYIGEMLVHGLCQDDTTCPAPAPCALPRAVPVVPFESLGCVVAPSDPGPVCAPCTSAAGCAISDACDVARCELGACVVSHELTAACCTPDPTWPGDPSFEGVLDPGWEADPGWAVSGVASFVGESSLHFGLSDGSAIALPGEAAAGTVWSPPVTLPRDAPVWSFALDLSTEWDAAPSADNVSGLDLLEALVVPVAAAPVAPAVVWDSRAIGGTTEGAWRRIRIALDRWPGQTVRLGLRFQTGDENANDGAGVFVDDARVFRACPGCGSEAVAPACDPGTVEP